MNHPALRGCVIGGADVDSPTASAVGFLQDTSLKRLYGARLWRGGIRDGVLFDSMGSVGAFGGVLAYWYQRGVKGCCAVQEADGGEISPLLRTMAAPAGLRPGGLLPFFTPCQRVSLPF